MCFLITIFESKKVVWFLAEESEIDDIEQYDTHTAVSTSGYAVGKRLLNLGLYGMDKEKVAAGQKDRCSPLLSGLPAPTAAEIVARKKRKKVLGHFISSS